MNIRRKIRRFFNDEKSGGIILIICTIISLLLANSPLKIPYTEFWHIHIGSLSIEHWINDALMAVFFLLIGLELEREIYIGEFSRPQNAILPIAGAIGGMLVPAGIFLFFNYGLESISGIGIPMATDIAFALGIMSLLGNRVPSSLKIFLMALAVIDDLGAIIIIAIFYTKEVVISNLLIALCMFGMLVLFNRLKIHRLIPYFIGGVIMWYFMYKSGIHATISGVLLAFVIPFAGRKDHRSPSLYLMHKLHIPVSFIILPLFALANTAIALSPDWKQMFTTPMSLGILGGLVIGKPLGITLTCLFVILSGMSKFPAGINWKRVIGTSCLGGIGFTMSIFIALLAFDEQYHTDSAKIVVLAASLLAGITGFIILKLVFRNTKN